jgi:hypothetical protein
MLLDINLVLIIFKKLVNIFYNDYTVWYSFPVTFIMNLLRIYKWSFPNLNLQLLKLILEEIFILAIMYRKYKIKSNCISKIMSFFFETASHAAQVGLKLTMQSELMMLLPQTLSAGIIGMISTPGFLY